MRSSFQERLFILGSKELMDSTRGEPKALYDLLASFSKNVKLCIFALIALNLLIYWQTLDGYFLADDFVHIAYLREVFSGHPEMLLRNFWSTWMQTEGTQFYRPLISVTLALDYLFWRGNSFGFHLSNLFFQCLSTVALYLFCSEVVLRFAQSQESAKVDDTESDAQGSNSIQVVNARLIAFFAASLFAAHPLHPEVVSWVIARVDSVCSSFYLISMWLFAVYLRITEAGRRRLYMVLSCIAFVLSLMSKEMAVTVPAAAMLLILFSSSFKTSESESPDDRSDTGTSGISRFYRQVRSSILLTLPLWSILVVYLVLRTLALGTFFGGYQGSIGEGLSNSIVERMLSLSSWKRVLLPLNPEELSNLKTLARVLIALYTAIFVSFLLRTALSSNRYRSMLPVLFSISWFAVVMVPAVPVWNLTHLLQGARFIYLGTAPLSFLLALLAMPVVTPTSNPKAMMGTRRPESGVTVFFSRAWCSLLGVVLSLSLIVLYSFIAFGNNRAWARAGQELRVLRTSLEKEVAALPEGKSLVLLNLPHSFRGAHMLYNAATLSVLLEPPLSSSDFRRRVVTFEPVLFGDEDLLRVSRLRRMLDRPSKFGIYKWDRERFAIEPVRLSSIESEEVRSFSIPSSGVDLQSDASVVSPVVNIPSLSADFLKIVYSVTGSSDAVPLVLEWRTNGVKHNLVSSLVSDGEKHESVFHISEHKSWVMSELVKRLSFWTPSEKARINIAAVEALSGKNSVPSLWACAPGFKEDESGVIRTGKRTGYVGFDAASIPGAQKVLLEVSKPDWWFEHESGSYRDSKRSRSSFKTYEVDKLSSESEPFDLSVLPHSGFYELRVAALDDRGEIIGYFSEPLMFQVSM